MSRFCNKSSSGGDNVHFTSLFPLIYHVYHTSGSTILPDHSRKHNGGRNRLLQRHHVGATTLSRHWHIHSTYNTSPLHLARAPHARAFFHPEGSSLPLRRIYPESNPEGDPRDFLVRYLALVEAVGVAVEFVDAFATFFGHGDGVDGLKNIEVMGHGRLLQAELPG